MLPPGKYTLQFTDTDGDGICCRHGQGEIVISAETRHKKVLEVPEVDPRSSFDVKVLAESDGIFEYRLSLAFVVSDLDTYTTADNDKHEINVVAIIVGGTLSLAIMVTLLTFASLRFCKLKS
jgi:hypothetical protein